MSPIQCKDEQIRDALSVLSKTRRYLTWNGETTNTGMIDQLSVTLNYA